MSKSTGFNLSAWTLRHKSLVFFLIGMVALFGVLSAGKLSQSEDPPFTFKTMVIQTNWPGATAQQVQEEVTDRIARKLQETPDIDFVQSYSRPGESQIFFNIKDSAPPSEVPETWYQIRKKVGDIQRQLPSGVQGPYFNDEFGDVYVNIYALQGDGYSPAQLHDYADQLRAELLRVPNVAKVDYFGDQNQHVYIDVDNARLAKLGITPQQLGNALNNQNAIASSGVLTTTDDRVFVRPSGQFESLDDLANALLAIGNKRIRLGDVASLHRGYDEPMDTQMRFLGHQVLGIGVSMTPGGNVIDLGKALAQTTGDLQKRLPAGLKLSLVTSMPTAVSHSVDDFLESVAEAVGIVLIVSLLSLGVRTGLVVVISIPFVLAATAWLMEVFGIGLHKVSLGTLVLALGLLVDDAIIAIEMMSVKLEQGWERSRAAAFAYTSTAFPMLTGTLITVSGFLPIAFAKSGTGEYTRSIFEVSAISLLVSWVAAVTLIPLLGYYLLPSAAEQANAAPRWWRRWLPARWRHRTAEPKPPGHEHDIYATPFYRRLQGWLERCMRQRWLVLGITVAMFVLAMIGFGMVPQQFFPSSDRPDLMVDLSLPEGASIDATLRQTKRLEALLASRKDVASYVSFVGSGAPRFYLPLDQKLPQPNFAQFLITASDIDAREHLAVYLQDTLRTQFPQVRTRVSRLENGPPVGFPVQFRVTGDDIGTVRGIAQQVAAVMRADAHTTNVQYDWDQPAERSIHLHVDQAKARALGVTSQDVANFLAMNLAGTTVTQLRERDKLIDVDLRAAQPDRIHPEQVENLMLPIPNAQPVPLSQLATISYDLEYGVIWERNRQPAIIVEADTIGGAQGVDVTNLIDPKLAQIRAHLPVGYRVEVGGSVEQSGKASGAINQQMPLLLIAVLTLLMIQLQSIGRTIMVVLTAPLGLIGVIIALLLFGKPFGFVAMLGTIAMFGIIMRNSVILVDQIEQDIQAGHSRWDAIIGATTRRFRPITVTAAAAVLALIPLLRSNFFGPMATALMGGITVATVLTLFYLPALYASRFRVRPPQAGREENVR